MNIDFTTLFAEAKAEVLKLLKYDNFPRWQRTPEFAAFVDSVVQHTSNKNNNTAISMVGRSIDNSVECSGYGTIRMYSFEPIICCLFLNSSVSCFRCVVCAGEGGARISPNPSESDKATVKRAFQLGGMLGTSIGNMYHSTAPSLKGTPAKPDALIDIESPGDGQAHQLAYTPQPSPMKTRLGGFALS